MTISRREFVAASLVAAAGGGVALAIGRQPEGGKKAEPAVGGVSSPVVEKAAKPLKVLFLGGTIFLGVHTVERLLARGHTVTLFNRGKSNVALFPDLEKLRGNRGTGKDEFDMASVKAEIDKGRRWDVVIDTTAYIPKFQRMSTDLLKGACDRYIVVSSVNAYTSDAMEGQDENAPTHKEWPEDGEVLPNYGPMKRGCEKVVEEMMPGRWAVLRPALIVGPRDPSDRFSYWPLRCKRGGEVLAPIGPAEPVRFVDARDLANLLVLMAEKKADGAFNGLGAAGVTVGGMLAGCIAAASEAGGPDCSLFYAPQEFLDKHRVAAWSDLPAWVPSANPEYAGSSKRVGKKSEDLGATWRPIKQSAADTLKWWDTLPEARRAKVRSGLSPEREAELIKLLNA